MEYFNFVVFYDFVDSKNSFILRINIPSVIYTFILIIFKKIMTIDNKTVKKVAKLAKIRITVADEEKLIYELNNILKWVDELKEVNTDNVEPMLSVFNESMFLREDKPSDSFSNKLILKNSPKVREGFFVVPKVVE